MDYGIGILIGLMQLAGVIALFLLRKIAFYLLTMAVSAHLIATVWHIIAKGFLEAIAGPGFLGALIGYALLIAVCIYSWKLVQRGVLE